MIRLRNLIVDGVLLALPIVAVFLLLTKAIRMIGTVTAPVAAMTPPGRVFGLGWADLVAAAGFVVSLIVLGAVARSAAGRWVSRNLERSVMQRIPGFMVLKSTLTGFSTDARDDFRPALLTLDDNTVLALVVENADAPDAMVTVYLPGSPSPTSGTVMMVARSRVNFLPTSTAGALRTMSLYGAGLQNLRRAASAVSTAVPDPEHVPAR